MRVIAHRGNTHGPSSRENDPAYVDAALFAGFDAEVDLRMVDGNLYLGHDKPQYPIPLSWLRDRGDHLWIHCKDLESLSYLRTIGSLPHYFFHDKDAFTLTSSRYIWTYPDKPVDEYSIIVLRDGDDLPTGPCYGICTDYPVSARIVLPLITT